ncbi:MAG: methyltransferase domain-containing protein [Pyrinomonadaceae bacterium]|nr:methyltransferase domain-containing protein [Pyrinomonadaceae bacterium]
MKYVIHQRDSCRICSARELRRFLHFDDMPFTDDFVSPQTKGTEFLAPLDIYWCRECKTSQTLHDVEVTDYYREYRYTASSSPFAQRFMRHLAEETVRRFGLLPGAKVIEVGSGDGYQLSCFRQLGSQVLGFEPSAELTMMSQAAGVPVIQCLFTADRVQSIPSEMRPADVVLLTYTFDHLPDPLSFLQAVSGVIEEDRGVLLIEVHDLKKIMERRETCLFAHEHSVYLYELTMKRLLERAGFKLLTTQLVPELQRRGNSLLVAAALQQSRHESEPFTRFENLAPLEEWTPYATFGVEVRRSYAGLCNYVRSRTRAGLRLSGYGAGGRGVMALAMADLDNRDITYLCDQNTSFHNLLTPRSHVPVAAPERLLTEPTDESIVFSFGYMNEIRQQLAPYEERGGKLISLLDLI